MVVSYKGLACVRLTGFALLLTTACSETSAPDALAPQFAKPVAGVSVSSTSPNTGPRGTTLTVRVFGSGFAPGFRAVWALSGDTSYATTRVKTNTTTYVSSTELTANITIESNASLEFYDIMVVGNGKKGIGIELFEVTYAFIDLGASIEGLAAINNLGAIAIGRNPSTNRPGIWENGNIRELPLLSGMPYCNAWDINDNGVVVGACDNGTGIQRAVMWDSQGAIHELAGGTEANSINNLGLIGGRSGTMGVAWLNGSMTAIANNVYLWDINESGLAAGTSLPSDVSAQYSLLWSQSTGIQSIYPSGEALGINDQGVVVGWGMPVGGQQNVAYRRINSTIEFLGTLGGVTSVAMGINEAGQIVGRSATSTGQGKRRRDSCCSAFVWIEGVGMRKLPVTSGWTVAWAMDINDSGWIVGTISGNSGSHLALWKPSF